MSDFRGPLPLDDRDFAEVRGKVMSNIERRSFAVPISLAAAAAIAFIIILLPQPQIVIPPAHPSPVVVVAQAPPTPLPMPVPVKAAAHKQPVSKPAVGAPTSDSETQITMNIETADPNVRIIWISR